MRIGEEIKQRNFESEFQKAQINILYTAAWMQQRAASALKPFNISWQQFNVLRILRGMHPKPATVKLLMERMIDKMSNASRLVEKLKQKGLVERNACSEDRRRVNVHITPLGLELLESASQAMEEDNKSIFDNLSKQEAELLNEVLDRLRG